MWCESSQSVIFFHSNSFFIISAHFKVNSLYFKWSTKYAGSIHDFAHFYRWQINLIYFLFSSCTGFWTSVLHRYYWIVCNYCVDQSHDPWMSTHDLPPHQTMNPKNVLLHYCNVSLYTLHKTYELVVGFYYNFMIWFLWFTAGRMKWVFCLFVCAWALCFSEFVVVGKRPAAPQCTTQTW